MDSVGLPDPELYILVSGKPSKQNVLWQSMVNIAQVRAAVQKLKQINWLYANIDDSSVDDASRRIVESVSDTTSTMLAKVTADDVKSFQSYTIRRLDQKQSSLTDSEHYKLMNVKEDALSNKLKHLDVLCFPTLFPSGRFGESHDRSTPISLSEFVKSRLLNRDSRFRKDNQYVFYLLWQKEMRELAAGVYNLMKGTRQHTLPVGDFMDRVSNSDENVEANLSTVFQSVRGSKQYWYLRHSEVMCMVREYGSPTLFLTLSCAEYESLEISNYLRKVNDVPDSYPIGKLCVEDPISVSRKFSQLVTNIVGVLSRLYTSNVYCAVVCTHMEYIVYIQVLNGCLAASNRQNWCPAASVYIYMYLQVCRHVQCTCTLFTCRCSMDVSQLVTDRIGVLLCLYVFTGVYCAVVCTHMDLGMYNVHVHCLHAGAQWMSRS